MEEVFLHIYDNTKGRSKRRFQRIKRHRKNIEKGQNQKNQKKSIKAHNVSYVIRKHQERSMATDKTETGPDTDTEATHHD